MDPADVEWQGAAANLVGGALFLFGLLWALWTLRSRRRARHPVPIVEDGPEDEPYRVFTRVHDVELTPADIPWRLHHLSPYKQMHYPKAEFWAAHRNHLRRFDATQMPVAEIEQMLQVIANPGDLALCLLIDQSGSMKGAPIAATASAVRVVSEALARIGATTEILGFSTAGWQGGFPRQKWLKRRRPPRPGRLCALAHIVYKRADEPEWTAESRDAFLHPDVLRENIDGEAIEWAAVRLAVLPAVRKLLVIVSDGAPIDDSTIQENGPNYLVRHLRTVIGRIEAEGAIAIGGVGIEHRVHEYYRQSREAELPELAVAITKLIIDLA